MKNLKILYLNIFLFVLLNNINAQNWTTSGNVIGATDYFGTNNNFALKTYTNSIGRTKLNGNINYTVAGLNGNRNGFMLLTNNPNAASWGIGLQPYNNPNFGAFSLFHLVGDDSPNIQEGGYRNWMRNGILLSNNFDAGFIGVRKMPNSVSPGADDVSDFVINWSDNAGTNPSLRGPDNLIFNFTIGDGNGTDDLVGNNLNGREIMRMNTNGNIGIGPRFNNDHQPKSTLHQHQENFASSWFQITNQTMTAPGTQNAPTPINPNNGFRIGINGNQNQQMNGNALIYNQETRHLLFSTNANTNALNFNNGTTLERMRITSISAPTNLATGAYGVYNPGGLATNLTRVAISHNPNSPVTRPLSLLHLGYNTGLTGSTPTSTDGWRNWMDIGTFTSNGTDNMYVGLKNEGNDRFDAIINWGDNGGNNPLTGPDNLRFIFTETTTSTIPGNPPATSNNGLEVARFAPQLATTLTAPNYGMMGIGDWTTAFNIANPINAKLDIDGDLRIRQVTQNNNLTQILAIDPTDQNRVHWVDANLFTGTDLGNYCSNPQNPLTGNYEIPLDNNNFLFSDLAGTGQVLMGDVFCGVIPDARMYVRNNSNSSGLQKGILVESIDPNGIGGDFYGDLYGIRATGASYAAWFDGDVYINGVGTGSSGIFYTSDQQFKTNIDTIANATNIIQQLSPKTFFFDTVSTPQIKFGSERQYGFIAQEVELILPELVSEHTFPAQYDSLGNQTSAAINYKGLNYNAFIAILMKGMQDQQAALNDKDSIISNLNDRLTTLENCLSGILPLLCQLSNASVQENDETTQKQLINELKVILEDNQNIVLEQNAPNPFAEQTVINYFIPEAVQQAQIVFYNLSGKMIQTINIIEKGNGKLTVYGNDLSSGTYTYSLIADGKLIATKKMVKK